MARERRWVTVSLARPTAVELSTKTGAGCWGWPSSSRVVRRGVASLVLWKRVPNSASAAYTANEIHPKYALKKYRVQIACTLNKIYSPYRGHI